MIVPSPRTLIEEVLFSLQYRLKPYFSVLVIVGLIFLLWLRKFFFVERGKTQLFSSQGNSCCFVTGLHATWAATHNERGNAATCRDVDNSDTSQTQVVLVSSSCRACGDHL